MKHSDHHCDVAGCDGINIEVSRSSLNERSSIAEAALGGSDVAGTVVEPDVLDLRKVRQDVGRSATKIQDAVACANLEEISY